MHTYSCQFAEGLCLNHDDGVAYTASSIS